MFKRPVVLLSVLAVFLCLSMLFVSCTQDASVETKQYGSIQGRVRYSNGSDHSGITVSLDKAEGQDGLSSIVNGIGTRNIVSIVSTKKDGSFSFSNVAPGMYTIYASSDDSVEKTVSTNVVVKGSETAKAADLRLTATGTVSGYMLIDGNTSGNGDYLVSLAGTTFMSVTDNSGYYSISGVPAGVDYQLVVSKGGLIANDVAHVSVTAHGLTNAGVIILASSDMVSDAGTNELVWKGSFSSSSAIQNPRRNWVYYNTIEKCYYIYDGMKWTPITDEEPEEGQGSAVSEVTNVSGTVGENLVYGGDFERGGDHDVMGDGAALEVVANKGIDGSNALRVQQTELYGEVYIDITKYYGQGKSYYVEASFKNNDSTKVSDLTARIDYWVVSGAVVKAVDSQWWEGYYDCDEIYTGEFLSNNEAMNVFGIETDGYEKTITDDGYVTIRGIIPASEIDRVLVETTNQYGSGEPTMYLLSVVFYVGSFLNQDGYNYYLDNVIIKDLNTEIPRQGATYDPSTEPEKQDDVQKWYRVKFDAQGGTYMAPVSVCEGESVSKPTDPVYEGYVFSGWFRDAACTQAYDFNSSVYGNITLYAKWVKNSTPSPYVPTDDSMVYRLTATHGVAEELYTYDKFIVEFRDVLVKPGDVLSFKYRSNIDFTFFSLRGDSKWFYERKPDYSYDYPNFFSSFEVMDDGWTYVSYEFPDEGAPTHQTITYGGEGTWFRIDFGSRTGEEGICIGDILEIKDLALNGEPLEITEDKITRGVAPTLEIVNASDWKACTVTFETLGGSTITPITVDFGRKIDMPAEPNKGGVLFTGWFEDTGYTIPFDSEMPITEDKVLYARWTSPRTVTFNSMGGSTVASVKVPTGWIVEKPADPEKDNLKFVGWYTDYACTNAFDFGSAVTQNITLYAKWAEASRLTLDFNYQGAPQDEVLLVGRGAPIEDPSIPIRAGYYFDGWYEEAGCTTAFDFTNGINEETTIYAKWIEPSIYKYTATSSHERFAFRFKETTVEMLNNLNPGDVISFQVRFTSTTTAPYQYRLRTRVNEKNICERTSFDSPNADGWYSIMVTVPESIVNGQGLYVHLYGNGAWAIGDICEIRGLAYNGVEIPITTSTSSGLYPGIEATLEIIDAI